jgi:RNA polymerase sigma-70 factor (ECF subfamily)
LESTIGVLHARGSAAHPDLAVNDEAFAAHLARCRAPLDGDPASVHAEDLLLACAALSGDGRAVAKLREDYWPIVIGYARQITTAVSSLDDLAQSLWAALLVGEPARPPKLASYAGIGSLAGFVGITAQRMALRKLRREDAAARTAERAAAETNVLAGDVELDLLRRRHREDFERAIKAALDRLDNHQRMILRMRVVDGLTFERIAKAYRVSQATVSRWLERARTQTRDETRRLLRERLPLTESEFEAFLGAMADDLDLSISSVLRATG